MRWGIAVLGVASWCGCSLLAAQTASDPKLAQRGEAPPPAHTVRSAEPSTLPAGASGEYLLDESGSIVQITLDEYKVTGYVTRLGDEESDKETPLTFFFDRAEAQASRLTFTTKKVHGVWYSFDGTIVRGDLKTTRDENGFYRLEGMWTRHNDSRQPPSALSEKISLKSTPRPAR